MVPRRESISLIIPAKDEVRRLGRTVACAREFLAGRGGDWEIVVVDDGSGDGTTALVEAEARGEPRVRLLRHSVNRGKGAAVRTGVLDARHDLVLFADADNSTPIEELVKLEAALEAGADVAIGSRALADSDVRVQQHPLRKRMGETFNIVVRTISGLPFPDTQCGFKLFRREHVPLLFGEQTVQGFAFDVEVLMRARRARLVVADVPVSWFNSEDSRVSIWRDPPRMARDLVLLRWRLREW